MSTILADTLPLVLARSFGRSSRLPQKYSWPTRIRIWRVIQLWMARRSPRAALGGLSEDEHLLADIGVTRERAMLEAAKPFWRK
jgi:uncharacterized protein YjiS (DUF1127 family)